MKKQETQCLLTKFFYRGNHLHFQILVQTETDWMVYDEYSDYGAYKSAFDQIQQALSTETKVIKLTEKNKNLETSFANVA